MTKSYTIFHVPTNRYIHNDRDFDNTPNCNVGEYALRPDGTVCFYQSDEGGMSVFEKEDCIVEFDDNFN